MAIVDFGVGAKYWLKDNIALRVDVRDKMVFDETIHNIEASAGVVFAFGGTSKATAVKDDKPVDSDGDGVFDPLDKCPNTQAGVAVDQDGCPLDTDKDGVVDYLDKCPGTPAGTVVDKDGCPTIIPEKIVLLMSEPKNDHKVIAAVAEKKAEKKVVILAFEDIHFDFNQATLTSDAKTILKRNIQTLKDNPNSNVRIAGYASAAGTADYNQKLSERRAKAVQEYLINEGIITPDRLSTIGYGETHPAVHESAPKDLYSDAAKANIRVLFEIIVQ
jgi:outer membrane protein OmpA-like peptidoglycan-associated protein